MNINDMTYGELKKIAALFSCKSEEKPHPMIGQYVIARCYSAGVHAGTVESVDVKTSSSLTRHASGRGRPLTALPFPASPNTESRSTNASWIPSIQSST